MPKKNLVDQQVPLFSLLPPSKTVNNETTFVDNMKLPVHRWFRYSAGFSAAWVKEVLHNLAISPELVLDPFAGSGTTLLACDELSVASVGVDSHPFVVRVARAKLQWNTSIAAFEDGADRILSHAQQLLIMEEVNSDAIPPLLQKAFSSDSLARMEALRLAFQSADLNDAVYELCWLAITAILRTASNVGTAPWQYVLPRKQKTRVVEPFQAFQLQSSMMAKDMMILQNLAAESKATMLCSDARTLEGIADKSVELVLTSPPYANNYDYADATRLEMTFWREIEGWGDLQDHVRRRLIRSCTQHASAERLKLDELLGDPLLLPIIDQLAPVCHELDAERHLHGGNKSYHLMVAAYFQDIARVWGALSRVCKQDAPLCFVLGDSAPYGIHLPITNWYAELAQANGFHNIRFVQTRDRNIKWANRTHSILLHEGHLWINNMADETTLDEASLAEAGGSATHTLGQLIGNFFQGFFLHSLQLLAERHGMYCDHQGLRPSVRGARKKVSWKDHRNTSHDLDYVIESGGGEDQLGQPKAFIELAWRRYTKHSRNKASEIEGALVHLGNTYSGVFLGAVLAGEWSKGSLEQMQVRGIRVLHIPFEIVAKAFDTVGLDVRYAEKTPDQQIWNLVHQWRQLSTYELTQASEAFQAMIAEDYQLFLNDLENRLSAEVVSVRILSLFGEELHFDSVNSAIAGLAAYEQRRMPEKISFVRYEVNVLLTNGADITGKFPTAESASAFLRMYH